MAADREERRTDEHEADGAGPFVPDTDSLAELAQAVQQCRGCDLYRDATQAVFGRGAARAEIVLLGEQPGDVEDRRGEPFVGPAGKLLHRALEEAGLAEDVTYLTNVVKHFRWRGDPRGGKRRIHQRPDAGQVAACRPWWQAEVRAVRPRLLVALGATAGEALFGRSFRVGATRGTVLSWPVPAQSEGAGTGGAAAGESAADEAGPADATTIEVVPTAHPSAVLRAPDRDEAYAAFVEDLRVVARLLGERESPARHAAPTAAKKQTAAKKRTAAGNQATATTPAAKKKSGAQKAAAGKQSRAHT